MGERKSFLLRIDGDLWVQLERWAQDDLRSVNGQIEYLLRQAVQQRTGKNRVSEDLRPQAAPRGASKKK
jgi:hypothetical protein